AVAGQLASQLVLSPVQIGQLFSVELGAMSLATVPAWFWLKRVPPNRAALLAAVIFIAGNIASATFVSYPALLVLRFMTALGAGSLMILCMVSAASLGQGSRVYGLWLLGQLVLGAIGLQVLPGLFAHYGLSACYLSLALLASLALPLTRAFPVRLANTQRQSAPSLPRAKAMTGLLAILCFYLSLSGVWTFIGELAQAAGIDAALSAQVLAIATLMGILGAALATFLGTRLPRAILIVAGLGLMAVAILLLQGQPSLARFAVAAMAFKAMWTFVLPLVLACVAELDPSGRLMNATNLVIGAGLAAGPALAGQLLQDHGQSRPLLFAAAALALLVLPLILCSRTRG
ncbi:MFS transporter, partial [Serratia sp. Se-RSmG]|uniref:MFS transporter n=1 Tax=Serratia sp. Se-RSmG TaxID=3043307 RepID=UPI0024AFAC2A